MSEEREVVESTGYMDSRTDGHRVPKLLYMVVAKGTPPEGGRKKTWTRVTTSKVEARTTLEQWQKFDFLDAKLMTVEGLEWEDLEAA